MAGGPLDKLPTKLHSVHQRKRLDFHEKPMLLGMTILQCIVSAFMKAHGIGKYSVKARARDMGLHAASRVKFPSNHFSRQLSMLWGKAGQNVKYRKRTRRFLLLSHGSL